MSVKARKRTPKEKTEQFEKMWENPMKRPFLEKIILNIGVGSGGEEIERAVKVLETITGKKPVKTLSKKKYKRI